MNNQSKTIVVMMVFVISLCLISIPMEDSEAVEVSSSEDFKAELEGLQNKVSEASVTEYTIKLTQSVSIDPIAITLNSNADSAFKIYIDLGGNTLTINDKGSDYGMKFTISDNKVYLYIQYGSIVDNNTKAGHEVLVIDKTGTSTNSYLDDVDIAAFGTSESGMSNSIIALSNSSMQIREGCSIRNADSDSGTLNGIHVDNTTASSSVYIFDSSRIEVSNNAIVSDGSKGCSIYLYNGTLISKNSTAIVQNSGSLHIGSTSSLYFGHGYVDGAVYGIQTGAKSLIMHGGSVSGAMGAINHTGDAFTSLTYIGGTFSSDISELVPKDQNYDVVSGSDGFSLSYNGDDAQASMDGVKYKTFGNALSAVKMSSAEKPELTLLDDPSDWKPKFERDVIIDMNGHTWNVGSSTAPIRVDGADVEITGTGTITSGYVAIIVIGTDDSNVDSYSHLTIGESVTITGSTGIMMDDDPALNYGVDIDIYGKIETTDGSYAMTINGKLIATTENAPHITIHPSAVIECHDSVGIFASGYAVWDVYGTVSGGTGIELRAGVLNVYDGAVISGGDTFSDPVANGSGTTSGGGVGILVSQHTTNLPTEVNIDGGTISGAYALYEKDVQDEKGSDEIGISVNAGTLNGTTSSVYSENVTEFIRGGTFNKFDATTQLSYVNRDVVQTEVDSEGNTVFGPISEEDAEADLDGTRYSSFEAAIEDAEEGATVTLLKSITIEPLTIRKAITLNLGDQILTIKDGVSSVSSGGLYFVNKAVKIVGGTIVDERSKDNTTLDERYTLMAAMAGANIDINGTTIQAYSPSEGYNDLIRIINQASFTLTDVTLKELGEQSGSDSNLNGITILGNTYGTGTSTLVINGQTGIDVSGYAINGNGSGSNDNTSITINDGSITSTGTTAIFHPQKGELVINGGTITGATAVEMRSGSVTVEDGARLVSTDDQFASNPSGNGNSLGGVALGVSQHSTNKEISVEINGGTFIGAYAVYETDLMDQDSDNINMEINNGTFIGSEGSVSSENVVGFINGGKFLKGTEDSNVPDTTLGASYLAEGLAVDDNTGALVEVVEVTFEYEGGPKTVTVPKGASLKSSDVPVLEADVGYEYVWTADSIVDPTTYQFTKDVTLRSVLILSNPDVSVNISGPLYDDGSITVTVTYTHPLSEQLDATFRYGTSDGLLGENSTGTFIISDPGLYTFVVSISDGEKTAGDSVDLEITLGETPFTPTPSDDEDYFPFPPHTGGGDSKDDSVTIVACAAAAAVAAILAVFLIMAYRKD